MPTVEEKARGVIRYRTIKTRTGKYLRVAIVRKRGPRGGTTVAGKPHVPKEHT